MQLAISTYSLWRWRNQNRKTLEQAIDAIADFKVSAVEFAGLDDLDREGTTRRAEKLRRHADKRGLRIAGYCVGSELFVPRAKQKDAIVRLKREVDVAAALGATKMRHDVTRGFGPWSEQFNSSKTLGTVLKVVVPAIREVADYAAGKGVRTSLENHGFYLQTPAPIEKLIQSVDHENFGLTLDMGNFLCAQEDPVAAVSKLLKYAQIVHAKDFHTRPKNTMPPTGWFATPGETALRGAILGHGVIDVARQIKLLKAAKYKGDLSLEFEGMEDPLQAIRIGLDYLRTLV